MSLTFKLFLAMVIQLLLLTNVESKYLDCRRYAYSPACRGVLVKRAMMMNSDERSRKRDPVPEVLQLPTDSYDILNVKKWENV
uniref:Uncharacterized protein n=1 Tax=Romanomermis culicivorax TaxID=13658 RepID=A0A915I7B5_ROMCU